MSSHSPTITSRSRLRVKPLWSNGLRCGQPFYDTHEEAIEYHVIPHDRYASFIDLGSVRLDLDETGCPVFVDVNMRSAMLSNDLVAPDPDVLCRHKFLDFPVNCPEPILIASIAKSLLHIQLSQSMAVRFWTFAPGSIWEVDANDALAGIWLSEIWADPSGCNRHSWRSGVWKAYRQGRLVDIASSSAHLECGWLSAPKIFS